VAGLQNRFTVFVRWTVSFITRGRDARLITGATLGADASQADAPAAVRGCRYLEDSAAWPG
jgi:NADH:ubiquinone reductase (H+-translocating)